MRELRDKERSRPETSGRWCLDALLVRVVGVRRAERPGFRGNGEPCGSLFEMPHPAPSWAVQARTDAPRPFCLSSLLPGHARKDGPGQLWRVVGVCGPPVRKAFTGRKRQSDTRLAGWCAALPPEPNEPGRLCLWLVAASPSSLPPSSPNFPLRLDVTSARYSTVD